MRNIFLTLSLVLIGASAFSQLDASVKTLIEQKDYFKLKEAIQTKPANDFSRKYAEAILSNAFGHYNESIKNVADWKTTFGKGNDSLYAELLQVNIDNYYKSNRYELAASTTKDILDNYGSWQSEEVRKDLLNTYAIWKGLANTPSQEIILAKSIEMPFTRDMAKLINLPVTHSGGTTSAVFDTGANISVANTSTSKKMGLNIVADSILVKAITGNEVYAQIGVAKEISIGEVVVKNPYFLVFPDEALSFGGGVYTINLIIGFPVIMGLGEVGFDLKKSNISFSQEHTAGKTTNMFVDGLTPIVQLKYKDQPLLFSFDSGADKTSFYSSFYDLVKTDKKLELTAAKSTLGGAGGMKTIDVMVAPELSLLVGGEKVKLEKSEIQLENMMDNKEHLFGNLGQDVLNARNKYVFNLKEMYFELR